MTSSFAGPNGGAKSFELPEFDRKLKSKIVHSGRASVLFAASMPLAFVTVGGLAEKTSIAEYEPTTINGEVAHRGILADVRQRIDYLFEAGAEDGIAVNETAARSLAAFIDRHEVGNKPQITLRDDGSLRALFKANNAELSIKFSGEEQVEAALLVGRGEKKFAKWAGFDSLAGVVDALHGFRVAADVLG